MSLDSALLPTGTHQIRAFVEDAAGNQTVVLAPRSYVVPDRATTLPASSPLAAATNGKGASRTAQLRITTPGGRRLSSAGAFRLAGRLVDTDSKPIAGATLSVQTRNFLPKPGIPQGPWATLGDIVTDANGVFRGRIPGGASRSLLVTYKAHPGDTSPSANAQTDVIVPAQVTVHPTARGSATASPSCSADASPARSRRRRAGRDGGPRAGPLDPGRDDAPLGADASERYVHPVVPVPAHVPAGDLPFPHRGRRRLRLPIRSRRQSRGQHPRQTMIRAVSLAFAIALLAAAPAAAEPVELTRRRRLLTAEFLLTATPPGPAATICLVDTGVNVNPDTVGVIGRLALTGETTDQSPTLHGTQMAMFIGAPSNGFGMVGIWPAARILSVRANITGQEAFTAVNYINGVKRCSDAAIAYGIKVVVMPAASEFALTPAETGGTGRRGQRRASDGISFVAAAGNNGGGPSERRRTSPASCPSAHRLGSGGLCSFSATGALLLAPGCALDGADPATGLHPTHSRGRVTPR